MVSLVLSLFVCFTVSANGPVDGISKGLKVGDKAVNFNLKSVDGKYKSLSSYKDVKGYVIVFTCNSCPYAVMYEDRLIELHNRYAPMGYPVIAINPNNPDIKPTDDFAGMQQRASDKGFPFDYLFDERQSVYPAYGATKTPHVYLVDDKMVVRYIGAIDDNARDASAVEVKYLENAIGALEKGEEPNPSKTKAIGCSIKA